MQENRFRKYSLFIIPLLFLMYSAPSALDYVFHFPDEKYYTDAALQMIEKNDYFTPYQADGNPRFLKPIATYWVVIGSYKLLGVSRFSSRVLFWLAGAILVMITFSMAKSFFKNRIIAITAAFITAANPLVLMSSSRSIPDILLASFLTLSAWGFIEIMLRDKPSKKYYWMAYLGAAFAFETKGIPAAAFAGISMFFLLLNPWKKVKLKKLLEPGPVIVSLLIALSWFILMYMEHGATYMESFFADQVGERVSSKTATVFKNASLGIINLLIFLVPWILIPVLNIKQFRSYINKYPAKDRAIFGFTFTWVVMIIIMSGAVFKFYDRYLLPIVPLASLFFAHFLTTCQNRHTKGIFITFLLLNVFILILNVTYAIFIFATPVLLTGIILCSILLLTYLSGALKNVSFEIKIANGLLLFYFNVFILLYPLLMPNPGKQLVSELDKLGYSSQDKVYVYGNIRTASNIRIHSNNNFNVVSMDTIYTLPPERHHYIVINKNDKKLLALDNYEIFNGSEEWLKVPSNKFPPFLRPSIENLKSNSTKYIIAKPGINK